MKKLAVVALGGNALLRGNQRGTIEEQIENVTNTMDSVLYLLNEGYDLIVAHGNGPQVGNILMQHDAGATMYDIPELPLDVNVAESQGHIGYLLENAIRNLLHKKGIDKDVVTLVTEVVVDKNDPAFKNPTKRVGRIYTKEQADKLTAEKGWIFKEEVKTAGGWRRVVPSPAPIDFMNSSTVERIARDGNIVITVGGGGIPVYYDEEGNVCALEAVIDKDMASSMVGRKVNADALYILTDVPFIYINYKQPDEEIVEFLNVKEAQKYMDEGMFGEGSMAPKIKACMNFVDNHPERKAIITEATKLADKAFGSKITMN